MWTRLGGGDRKLAQRQKSLLQAAAAAQGTSVAELTYRMLLAGGLGQLERKAGLGPCGCLTER